MKRLVWFAALSLLLATPLLAHAADGYVTGNVNLRAGPDGQYPLIFTIPAGSAVSVQGCTSGWEWCDVIVRGNRGWVDGYYIQYQYQNRPVALPDYGAQIGVPIVTFVIATYWNNYYRNRPFYRQRNSWYSRPIPHRPPPRPIHRLPTGHRPPPAKPRPPVNRPTRPKPPATNPPKPQPRPPANRPPAGQRPKPQPTPPGNGPGNKPGGNRPTTPPKGQPGKPNPKPYPNPSGNNGGQ